MKILKVKDIKNQILLGDSTKVIKQFPDKSFSAVITDPPYEYLDNQKHKFDKRITNKENFAKELFRIIDNNGFLVWFGRGTSFYEWNTIFNKIGFKFKEEIIWDKTYGTSPLATLIRKHETISIWSKGKGKINRVYIPFEKTPKKRIMVENIFSLVSAIRNKKEDLIDFLKTGNVLSEKPRKEYGVTITKSKNYVLKEFSENGWLLKKIIKGFPESSIIQEPSYTEAYLNLKKIIDFFLNDQSFDTELCKENTFIEASGVHFNMLHPTQKPIDLMIRLIQLVRSPENNLILDPFAGSGSTLVACKLLGIDFVGIEINPEYHKIATKRLNENTDKSHLLNILKSNQNINLESNNYSFLEIIEQLNNLKSQKTKLSKKTQIKQTTQFSFF
jgi:site-specific DNA-methyltransferase (adenine-specific)